MQEGPKLLIEWESRRRGFIDSVRPAFSRSQRRLLVEINRSRRPVRPILLSYLLHLSIVFALITVSGEELRRLSFVEPIEIHPEHYEIVYVPSNSLPQMTDAGGAASGSSGSSGGSALHTEQQVIKIVRGNPIVPHVTDVPKLALPHTETPANLLIASAPAPSVPANAIQHERIQTVQAFASTSAVAPPPEIVRERVVAEPVLPVPQTPPPVVSGVNDTVAGSRLELPKPVPPPSQKDPSKLAEVKPGVPPPDLKSVDVGSLAPPSKDTSVVMSSQPGDSVGKPASQAPGAIAMSPTGAGKPGVGEGLGSSAAHGGLTGAAIKGTGTGTTTAGPGAGSSGTRAGISPGPGPGGSGTGMIASAIPGVTIRGGTVMIPSFGPTPGAKGGSRAHMPGDPRNVRPVTIVATDTAGGAVSARGLLRGAKVYTIYIDTTAGLAFLQFAEHAAGNAFQQDLTVPEPLVSNVPPDLRSARVLLAGSMDRNGSLRNMRVVEAVSQDVARRLIETVQHWHFRPALRGDDPVEVDAIFGLNVDTK